MTTELEIRRAARAIRDAAYSDSLVTLDPRELRTRLEQDAKTAGYMMTDKQCDHFIMAEDNDPDLLKLIEDFPLTHAYLNTFW